MSKPKKEVAPLTPPDLFQCQADKPNGNSFITQLESVTENYLFDHASAAALKKGMTVISTAGKDLILAFGVPVEG
jgi:hypothetical protein